MAMEMVKKVKLDAGFDRLSSLPDPIRAHILSFLPTKDAVKTCILSNTWRALWTQLPILDLRWLKFPSVFTDDTNYFGRRHKESNIRIRELFYEFLDRAFVSLLMLEIEAPSLLELTYECEDLCDNEGYCDLELFDCTNLKKLKAFGAALDDKDLHSLLEKLPALEELHLYHCDCLRSIEILSPRLVHLELIRCEWILKATINAPNLKYFYFEDDKPIELPLRGLTPRLKEASIYLKLEDKTDKWYTRLVKFLAKFRHCEHLGLCVGFEKDLRVPENVRMKNRPPLSGVKHLFVEVRASFKKRTPVSFIQGLLWLAPCSETISIYNNQAQICKSLELIHEMPLKGQKKCGCFKSLPINCWRHTINRVSIENKKAEEDDTELANFFRNARIDGKLVECCIKNSLSEPQKNSSC